MHFNTRCKCNPDKSEQRHMPDMRHMLVPVGKEARVGERGDIEGSYPSFCYSAADPFAALVRELAATSTGRKRSREREKAPEEKEELHLVEVKISDYFKCAQVEREREKRGQLHTSVIKQPWHKKYVKYKISFNAEISKW